MHSIVGNPGATKQVKPAVRQLMKTQFLGETGSFRAVTIGSQSTHRYDEPSVANIPSSRIFTYFNEVRHRSDREDLREKERRPWSGATDEVNAGLPRHLVN